MSLNVFSCVHRVLGRLVCLAVVCSLLTLEVVGQQSDAAKGDLKKQVIAKIEWTKISDAKELNANTSLEKIDGESVLKVTRDTNAPQLIPLATIKEPKLKEQAYALRGKVRVEGIVGEAFLEMWNHFPEPKPGPYFTRTVAESGPMGKLRGTAPWREFILPFRIDDKSHPAPIKLQINAFLADKGTVWLTDLTLEEMPIDQLETRLQGSAGGFPGWIWGLIALAIFVPIATVLFAVRAISRKMIPSSKSELEIRRMKALDLNWPNAS